MPRVRYTGPVESLTVAPAGHPAFSAERGAWVDAPAEVVGRAPKGKPGNDGHDPGEGLLAQGDWDADGKFAPHWERESKSAANAAKSEE